MRIRPTALILPVLLIASHASASPAKPLAKAVPAKAPTPPPVDDEDDDPTDVKTPPANKATTAAPDSTAFAMGGEIVDDQPYEDITDVQKEADISHWAIGLRYSGAVDPSYSSTWNFGLDKWWTLGTWTPSLELATDHQITTSTDYWDLTLGSGLGWSPVDWASMSAAARWTTMEGPDDLAGSGSLTLSQTVPSIVEIALAGEGAWSTLSRGTVLGGLSLSTDPELEWGVAKVGGTVERRYQAFQDVAGKFREEYVNAFGWSASIDFDFQNWSTGPSYSGEYWKANTTGSVDTSLVAKNRKKSLKSVSVKIPATGKSISHNLGWNLTWTPLRGIALSIDAFRTWGDQSFQSKQGNSSATAAMSQQVRTKVATLQKSALESSNNLAMPSDSWGFQTGFRFSW